MIDDPDLVLADIVENELFSRSVTMSIVKPNNLNFVLANHGFATGDRIWFRTTGKLLGDLQTETDYFVINFDSTDFRIALTEEDALAGNEYFTDGTQSGTHFVILKERVVVYDENWEPPKDLGIYITIQTGEQKIIGNNNYFDETAGEEVKTTILSQKYTINITSKNREALQRKEEVVQAFISTYSRQQQELNQFRIFRGGNILDLSFIENASALHRYQIDVIIHLTKTKRTIIPVFDQFEGPQTEVSLT